MIGCKVDNAPAIRACETDGFTNCRVTETSSTLFSGFCGNDDTYAYSMFATNIREQNVSIVVCCGYLKGCTIRTQ